MGRPVVVSPGALSKENAEDLNCILSQLDLSNKFNTINRCEVGFPRAGKMEILPLTVPA